MNQISQNICPLERVIKMIDGKWRVLILWHLRNGHLRFSELQRKMPTITQKMLTQQLRELERHDLISRTTYPEVPPRVEYELTEHGNSLMPLLVMVNDWGTKYYEDM